LLADNPPVSPVTASIRLIPAKSERQCGAVLRPLLIRRLADAIARFGRPWLTEHLVVTEHALCAGAPSHPWYALRLHLLRREETIVSCEVLVLDRQRRPIAVPFFGPRLALTLDPSHGIQAGLLTMEPSHDARVEWMLLPNGGLSAARLRNVGGFGRSSCEAVNPDNRPR
jgi:hypothetical protein